MEELVYPMIDFTKRQCKELVSTINQNLLQSLFRILNCFFERYIERELVKVTPEDILKLEESIRNLLVFALVWSVGGSIDYDSRPKFSEEMRKCLAKKGYPLLPKPFYEYHYNEKTNEFEEWTKLFANFEIPSQQMYHEIIVPTADSYRSIHMTKMLLSNDYHVITPGPTGTGKSINAYNLISAKMGEIYQYIPITFSAQTSANQTQDTIDLKLEKIKRGVYGAPVGKKYIIFIDDLNMPKKEEYGAQPPIELIRQFFDHHGWYNRKDQQFLRIENIVFLTALGPPGGGRTFITPRIVRHFNMLSYNEMDNSTVNYIFNTMTNYFLKRFTD